MVLLGGIVENSLLSRNELMAFAQMPSLQVAQAQLVQTLNQAAGTVVQQLQAHQVQLVKVLDVHAKGDATTSDETKNDTPAQTT